MSVPAPAERRGAAWLALVAALAAAALVLPRLGARSLADWDEAIYAQVAREMLERGELLVPFRGGEPFLEKPPLYFWFTAGCYLVAGVSEAAARLGSALSGIALAVVVVTMGLAVGGGRTALVAALALGTSAGFALSSRSAMLDVPLTLAVWAAVASYQRARRGSERHWYLVALAAAAAVMLKSAAGLIAPLAIAAALALDGGWRTVARSRAAARAAVLFVALTAPWHAAMTVRFGAEFLESYLGYHVIGRARGPLETHGGGPLFYLRVLPTLFGAWTWLLPVAVVSAARGGSSSGDGHRLVHITGLVALLLVLIVRTRIAWYLLPVLPALAIMVGTAFDDALREGRARWLGALWLSACVPAALAPGPARAAAAALLAAGLLGARIAGRRAVAAGALAALALLSLAPLRAHFAAGRQPLAVLAAAAAPADGEGSTPLVLYTGAPPQPGLEGREPSARFYGRRPVRTVRTAEELSAAVEEGARHVLFPAASEVELSSRLRVEPIGRDRGLIAARVAPRSGAER